MSLPTKILQIKGKSGYWVRWHDQETHKKRKKKLGPTLRLATAALTKLQRELLLPPKKTEKYPNITLKNYFKEYKKDFLSEASGQSWSGKQRMHFEKYILPVFKKKNIKEITLYDVEAWYKTLCRNHPRKYANHIARTLKTSLKRCEGKYLPVSPIRDLKLLGEEKKIPEIFTKKQIGLAVEKLTGRDLLFFMLGISTGLRKAELQFLQWSDIDLIHKRLFVRTKPEHRIKDCEDRTIPLVGEVLTLLKQYKSKIKPDSDDYIFEKTGGGYLRQFEDYVRRVFKLCGLNGGSANLMRHSFASMFLSQGGNLAELKSIMGHSSIVITEKNYAAYLPPEKSSVHNIDFGFSESKSICDGTPAVPQKK